MTLKNVLSKVGLDVHKEKVLLTLITPHRVVLVKRRVVVVKRRVIVNRKGGGCLCFR